MQFIKSPVRMSAKTITKTGETVLERKCIQQGMRITGIRQAVLDALEQATRYLSAEEIYLSANQENTTISMSAAYCTLKLLADMGVIKRRRFQSKQTYYWESETVICDHLIDIDSGRVIGFRNAVLDKLKTEIAQAHGFNVTDCRIELYVSAQESLTTGKTHHD